MPNGGISLLPEEMRKKEEEELEKREQAAPKRPELYVPGKQEGPKEPESVGIGQPPKQVPKTQPPIVQKPPAKPEEIVPFKQRPKQARPTPPPRRQVPPAPKRSLRVSLIPEEKEEKRINIKGRKIALAITVVIEIIILGVGMIFLQSAIASKNDQMNKIGSDIEAVKTQLNDLRTQEKDLYVFEEKLDVMGYLLDGHIYTSRFFKFLEDHTLPEVWYTTYISTDLGIVTLQVSTSDLKTAAKQIAHIKAQEEVFQINVNNFQTNIDDLGQIIDATFEMQIIFQEDFLISNE